MPASSVTAGIYTYMCEVANSACALSTSSYTVQVVGTPPSITTQPTASSAVCSGGTVSLSVVASGATAYQWKKNGANVTDGTGGTTANYTTAALTANATYTVVVSNGSCSITSTAALVTLTAAPGITTQPTASSTVCAGSTVSLSVVASGATAYQWKKNGTNVTDGTGGTITNYRTAALTANATYTVVVSNGSCPVTSNNALVTVVATPPTPTLTRSAGSVCVGTAITFTASGGNGNYDWKGYFTGTGSTRTTPQAAGTYTTQVRSFNTSLGTVCYSAYTSLNTVYVQTTPTFEYNEQPANACGCPGNHNICGRCYGKLWTETAPLSTCNEPHPETFWVLSYESCQNSCRYYGFCFHRAVYDNESKKYQCYCCTPRS
jgi:hypothetical protein